MNIHAAAAVMRDAMPRRILIASTPNWSFCLAVEREIARRNADAVVDLLDLVELLEEYSPHRRRIDLMIERLDRKKQRFLLPLISGREITGDIHLDPAKIPPLPDTVEGLREYRVGEARVGLSVLSSVVTITAVQHPRSVAEYGSYFPDAWVAAHLSAQIGEAVAKLGYDEVHVFNGRTSDTRPFCDVVERVSRVMRYEQGGPGDRYVQTDRNICHPATFAELLTNHDFDPKEGDAFYRDRFRKAPGDIVNFFTAGQVEGHVPDGLEKGRIVSYFTSSSDETLAVSDDIGYGDFENQSDAALAVARAARAQGFQPAVRLHPHLQHKHPSWVREWDFDALRAEGATVVMPDDPVDTYALSAASHCVFTSGSTVGFECTFRGIPNANIGYWHGPRMGGMACVMNEEEIGRFIAQPFLPEGAMHAALLYGSFYRVGGIPLPELDVGSHPNYARVAGKIVDPVRYAAQRVKDLIRPSRGGAHGGLFEGKAIMDAFVPGSRAQETQRADG
jgi:hypothetical protein